MLRRRDFGGEQRAEEGATELAEGWILLSGYSGTQGNSRLSLAVARLQMQIESKIAVRDGFVQKRRKKGGGDGWQMQGGLCGSVRAWKARLIRGSGKEDDRVVDGRQWQEKSAKWQ